MSLKRLCCNPWTAIICQTTLGVIFIIACYHKILEPPDFAKQIYNYKITPGEIINLTAIYLPWIELVAGIALIIGIWNRGATTIIGAMLLVFIAALTFNYLRGHAVECGCFTRSGPERTPEVLFGEMRIRILEDIGMLILAIWALWIGPVSRPWLPGWGKSKGKEALDQVGA